MVNILYHKNNFWLGGPLLYIIIFVENQFWDIRMKREEHVINY
jgi:hypothetical protein